MSKEARKARTTDDQIIEELVRSIMDNEFAMTQIDRLVRIDLGLHPATEVDDNSEYWDKYSARVLKYTLQAVIRLIPNY